MGKRALSLTKQADEFLLLVIAAGSIRGQWPTRFISALTLDAYEAVFKHIPEGTLPEDPTYQDVDPDFEGYSRYTFSHGRLTGVYASSPKHVVILELRIEGRIPLEAIGLNQAVA
jgi:hypothetical protein